MILFHAEREETVEADENEILQFCNEWNKKRLYDTAVYDKENGELYLDYTLPQNGRVIAFFQYRLIIIWLMPSKNYHRKNTSKNFFFSYFDALPKGSPD